MANSTLAVLFADVVGSTKLYEVMGDTGGQEAVARCLDVMANAVFEHSGAVIKTMGDGILATFPIADDAAASAATMQRAVNEAADAGNLPLSIRVGFNFGRVMLEQDDIFGTTVHMANRMSTLAKAAQIVTTGETLQGMSPEWQAAARKIDVTPVRGKKEDVEVYEVMWEGEDATRMITNPGWDEPDRAPMQRLRLRYRNDEVIVDKDNPQVSIGRGDDSDLVVQDALISRLHAHVEFRRGKFYLIDKSTNGSCLRDGSGEEQFIRRDTARITGQGLIGLGQPPESDPLHAIYYVCEE